MTDEFHTIGELEALARAALPDHLWDFANMGAGTGATRRRSRAGLDALSFRPRVLQGVGTPDPGIRLLGWESALPILLAPVGSIARYHRDGALNIARAAGELGTIGFMGGLALPSLEDVARVAAGPMIYQIYVAGDRAWLADLVARAAAAGYEGICVTGDSVAPAFRDALRRHGWAPVTVEDHPNLLGAPDSDVARYMSHFTWDDLEWLRGHTDLPLMLKGVLRPDDAARAVALGIDVVYVSNHGGLVLDHGPAVTDVLPGIRDRVGDGVPLIADGGVMRGTDVVKMLALGADAVAVGRLACWAAAVGGWRALARAVRIVEEELIATMAMLGAATVADLEPSLVAVDRPLPD